MPAAGGIPTLSQVRSWNTEHLTEGAEHWTRTAVVWEDSFTELANRISMPGGTPWEGEAADAAFTRAHTDRMSVIGLADELHAAARIARTGATEISSARGAALRVVDAAGAVGFVVGEDFSVTSPGYFDPVTAAVRQAQAEAIATDLRATVGTLMATDAQVAARLTAATATLGTTVFPESEDEPSPAQLVGFKTAPSDKTLSEARKRAIEYADRWAGNADDPHRGNPDYANFGDGGGDCTNFASQAMRAGGFEDIGDGLDDWHRGDADDWYYNNGLSVPGNTNSSTWSVAQDNRDFIVNSGRGQVVGTAPMPARAGLDPLAPSKAGLVPGGLIYYHDKATGTINHTAVYVGQEMRNGALVDIVDQHADGGNNFRNDWMPDGGDFLGRPASVEFVHLTYPGE